MNMKFELLFSLILYGNLFSNGSSFILNRDGKMGDSKYEIVYLPVISEESDNEGASVIEGATTDYTISAFQMSINLKLKRNDGLISPNFKLLLRDGENSAIHSTTSRLTRNCHYLHRGDDDVVAAISNCRHNKAMQGFIFLSNATLEIHPFDEENLDDDDEPVLFDNYDDIDNNRKSDRDMKKTGIPHLVKRSTFSTTESDNDVDSVLDATFPIWNNDKDQLKRRLDDLSAKPAVTGGSLTVELAMFFDEAGYKLFSPFMGGDDHQLEDMLLAYLNGVQALYHHPSLGTSIELVLVRLDIMKTQPGNLPHYDGERGKLLDSFCAYQHDENVGDEDPDHWDMALYISGLDFFAYENGRKSGATMGLATVGGVCLRQYACIIAELGTTNVFGKPYPSAGFTSVYILAHEIGHNLGMHHDGVGNACPKEGYVMSPSRGTNGETQWSSCSADIVAKLSSWAHCLKDQAGRPSQKKLDHSRFLDTPGRIYTAKKQCQVLLRDRDAVKSPNQELSSICFSLQCKTPHRSGYYSAGPALEGTQCGVEKYCYGGDCVYKAPQHHPKPVKIIKGGWGPWKADGECTSGCIKKSRGFEMKRRKCNNPVPVNTDEGCEGSNIEFGICKDAKICGSNDDKRTSVENFASGRCRDFAQVLPTELDSKGVGLQATHEEARVWMGCAIFCKRADSSSFYTPRIELNDLGFSPYFPDGTWCHNDGVINYYCLYHHCLPQNFQFSKGSSFHGFDYDEDFTFSQNAQQFRVIPPDIKSYFTLDLHGKPLKTILQPHELMHQKEDDWETNDYVEIPGLRKNETSSFHKNRS